MARDPKRLDEIYTELKELHKENVPDWRIGQLICNIQRAYGNDLFYVEDSQLLSLLHKYFYGDGTNDK